MIGEAYEEIKEATNKEFYNVKFKMVWKPEMGEFWKEIVRTCLIKNVT